MYGREFLEDEFKQRCKHSEHQFGAEANARYIEGHVESFFSSLTTATNLQAKDPKICAQIQCCKSLLSFLTTVGRSLWFENWNHKSYAWLLSGWYVCSCNSVYACMDKYADQYDLTFQKRKKRISEELQESTLYVLFLLQSKIWKFSSHCGFKFRSVIFSSHATDTLIHIFPYFMIIRKHFLHVYKCNIFFFLLNN